MAGTILEKVSLNFTDLTGDKTGCTTLGSNKFWTGFVEQNPDGTCNFECRWGSTGTPGSDKGSVRNTSESAALSQLHKKVAEKEKKGYTRLDVRSDHEEMTKAAAKGVPITSTPQNSAISSAAFHPEVGRLLGIIYGETSRVVRAGLSAQAGATAENPIGNLSDRQLDVGGGILDEIEVLLKYSFGRETSNNRSQTLPLSSTGIPDSQIIDLTNRFMSNVPREIGREMRGRDNLYRLVLSSYERLDEQRKFLQLLRDAHLSKDVFQAAAHTSSAAGKEQVWYNGLNCDIEICERGSADYQKVVEIFTTGQSRKNGNWWRGGQCILQVARVFKFTRKGSDARFNAYADKVLRKPGAVGKLWAWHGTATPNVLGISQSGLLMPENLPRGVPKNGKAFGMGIYHAPNTVGIRSIHGIPSDGTNGALKSANYLSLRGARYGTGNTANNGFMFLQEVAVGLADVRTRACWDQHLPNGWPTKDVIYAASSQNTSEFVHDEMVTFDQDAQVFRYLIEVEVR